MPVARHAGNGHDLAAAQGERRAIEPLAPGRGADALQHAHRLANMLRWPALRRADCVAHHPLRQLRLRGALRIGLRHQLACAQHRHALRHAQHLSELVADKNNRQALRHHLRQHREQRLAFLRREHGGGFVQNQNARAPVQRLQYLDPLALAHREAAHQRVGVHAQAKALRHLGQLGARGRAACQGQPQRLGAHHHVVEHAQVVGQGEVLVHHANARVQRGLGVARRQRLAKHGDAAGVCGVVAKQDGHQRRFARAVLAQQRQNLARLQVQRDGVIGHQRAKTFADADEG